MEECNLRCRQAQKVAIRGKLLVMEGYVVVLPPRKLIRNPHVLGRGLIATGWFTVSSLVNLLAFTPSLYVEEFDIESHPNLISFLISFVGNKYCNIQLL